LELTINGYFADYKKPKQTKKRITFQFHEKEKSSLWPKDKTSINAQLQNSNSLMSITAKANLEQTWMYIQLLATKEQQNIR